MNKKLIFAGLLYILILSMFVSAGTLISGSTVQIDTDSPEFGAYNLLFTWSSTPTASDTLTISRDNLPAGYDMDREIDIVFQKPVFEQVFAITKEELLEKPKFVHRTYWYIPQFDFDDAYVKCIEKHQEDLAENFGGATYLSGVSAIVDWRRSYCDVRFVYVESTAGYLGDVTFRSWNYDQEINVGDLGTLELYVRPSATQKVDSQSNIGKATLLGFDVTDVAALPDKNMYAYQEKSGRAWIPVERPEGLVTYTTARDNIRSLVNSYVENPTSINIINLEAQIQNEVQKMRDEVNEISNIAAGIVPTSWRYATGGGFSYSGKNINVPITENILIPEIQFLINGDTFRLHIPLGEPEFVSTNLGNFEFEELEREFIEFSIRNLGEEFGTFQIQGDCNTDQVNIQSKTESNIAGGSTWNGVLEITAVTDKVTKTENFQCELIVKDLNSNIEDTAIFGLTVIPAESCAEGEETLPTYIDGILTVYVLDSRCQVKDTKICQGVNKDFVLGTTGKWECVDVGGELIEPPVCGDGLCENSEVENGIYPCPEDCGELLDNAIIITVLILVFVLAIGIIVALAIKQRK